MSTLAPESIESPTVNATVEPSHEYHAEAHALSGFLHHPVYQRIDEKASVKLREYRGDHRQEKETRYNLEGIVTFESAQSRVSGSRNLKNKGWITLSTSVLEGLNVLEVITADRVVSQVSTEHAYIDGHVPSVTFLGSQFVNLRLSGFPLEPTFNFGICGTKPSGVTPYVKHLAFLQTVEKQTAVIANNANLPSEVRATYSDRLKDINGLIGEVQNGGNGRTGLDPIVVTCSLITTIDITEIKKIIPGVESAGNVLFIPEFGTVALAEIDVKSTLIDREYDNYFNLKMFEMKLGCVGNGSLTGGSAANNGGHKP
jgi:hypothetical protein